MDIADLVTDVLAADSEEASEKTIWEELHTDTDPKITLPLGREALQALEAGDPSWRRKVALFATGLRHHRRPVEESKGLQLFTRLVDFEENPANFEALRKTLQEYIDVVELEVHTASPEDAFAYLESIWSEDWADVAAEVSGVKPVTVLRWKERGMPSKKKAGKLYCWIHCFFAAQQVAGVTAAKAWSQTVLPTGDTPLQIIARSSYYSYSYIPYEVRISIDALKK